MLISAHFSPASILICLLVGITLLAGRAECYPSTLLNFEYYTSASNYQNRTEDAFTNGLISSKGSQSKVRWGQAFVLVDANGNYDGCQAPTRARTYPGGIAIIQRGGNCTFSVKITRAKQYGAAGYIHAQISMMFAFDCF